MTICIYPGSFDPFTLGHLDIATRAAGLFEKIIIGVYDNPAAKRLLFSTKERVSLTKDAVKQYSNIEVRPYTGLTVDFAKETGATVMIRGLRILADFEREFEIALMNQKLSPEMEMVCFMTKQKYQFVSSSLIKEVYELGGNISDLVPKAVDKALKKKFSKNIENTGRIRLIED